MLSYCLKCRKNKQQSKSPENVKTKNGRIMLLSTCSVCNCKNIEEQEATGLLSNLGIMTPLSKILLVGSLLF